MKRFKSRFASCGTKQPWKAKLGYTLEFKNHSNFQVKVKIDNDGCTAQDMVADIPPNTTKILNGGSDSIKFNSCPITFFSVITDNQRQQYTTGQTATSPCQHHKWSIDFYNFDQITVWYYTSGDENC